MQLGLGWIFVGAYAVENGRSIDIALLRATSLYTIGGKSGARDFLNILYPLIPLEQNQIAT